MLPRSSVADDKDAWTKPVRVAFVDYVVSPEKPGRSGLSDMVWDMASELGKLGHEPHIVGCYRSAQYPDPMITVHNFPEPPVGYRNILGHTLILRRAAQYVRRIRPDIIHVPEYFSAAVLSYLLPEMPTVMTTPGNIYYRLSVERGSSYEWYYAQILKWAARRTAKKSHVIAISEDMKYWWGKTGVPEGRLRCIPLGADSGRFYFMNAAREHLGLARAPFLMLYVGRFSREKGVVELVQALSSLSQCQLPPYLLVMIGQGPLLGAVRKQIEENDLCGSVSVLPWVDQKALKYWYSAADVVVLPSYTEGMSRIIPEAMSCGTPVIGSAISGTRDHVKPGYNGALFTAGRSDELAELLASAVLDPRVYGAMRGDVERYAKENLAWSKIVPQVINQVYRPLLNGVRAGSER